MSGDEFTWNCGVEVIGPDSPHRGAKGTVMPFEYRVGGVMLFVQYDEPAADEETAGYHFPDELKRLPTKDISEAGTGGEQDGR